jgi:hypothetical protein
MDRTKYYISFYISSLLGFFCILIISTNLFQYMTTCFIFLLSFIATYSYLKHKIMVFKLPSSLLYFIPIIPFVIVSIYGFISPINKEYDLTGKYYASFLIPSYAMIIVIILTIIYLIFNDRLPVFHSKLAKWIFVFLGLSLIVAVAALFHIKYIMPYDLHYDAYFYPVYRILSGQLLYVDFENIYGNYAYIMAALIHITGGENNLISSFSTWICILTAISFISIYYILSKICRDAFFNILGIAAIMFFPTLFLTRQQGYSYYLQYVPHRILFPCLILAFITYIFYSKKIKYWNIIIVLNAFAMFWNFETGIICALVSFLCDIYYFLINSISQKNIINGKKYIRELLLYILKCFIKLCIAVLLFVFILELITYISSSNLINPLKALFGLQMFSAGILSSTKINTLYWIFIWMIPGIGITLSIKALLDHIFHYKEPSFNEIILFPLSVLCLGLMTYALFKQQHPYNLSPIFYIYILIMIAISQNKSYNTIHKNRKENYHFLFRNIVLYSIVGIIGCSLFTNYIYCNRATYKNVEGYLPETLGEIEKNVPDQNKLTIMTINSSYFYYLLDLPDNKRLPATADWFGDTQSEQVLQYLQTSEDTIVIDNLTLAHLALNKTIYQQFEDIMNKRYQSPYISTNENIHIYLLK